MVKLYVNVDHVATVRQARMIDYPDPLEAALIAEKAGCAGITVHLREDRRHIQDHDVFRIREAVSKRFSLEMAASDEIIEIAHQVMPDQVSFVPERRQEITTEGGLDATRGQKRLKKIIERFQNKAIPVSLFIDPDPDQIKAAIDVGASTVELHTGQYSEAKTKRAINAELNKIKKATRLSEKLSIETHAGHGLHLGNVGAIAAIPNIEQLHIGHSIVSRALMVGFRSAVKEILRKI